jgi:hypothetical protein
MQTGLKAAEHTLTTLSQPALTMTGFCGFGLNRTHDTHSVWPFSVMVYLQSPRVFHSLMVRSREPDTICLLSAEKETERMSLVWPTKRRVVAPVDSSQRRSVLSQDDERAYAPSDEMTCSRRQCDFGAAPNSRSRTRCANGRAGCASGTRRPSRLA